MSNFQEEAAEGASNILADKKRALLQLRALRLQRECNSGFSNPRDQIESQAVRPGTVPLALAQERLWLLSRLSPGDPAYNVVYAFEIHGRLDVPAFERSINALVQRHEILRTRFDEDGGVARQIIVPHLAVQLPVISLESLGDAVEPAYNACLADEIETGFELSRVPLLRLRLFYLAPERYWLLFSAHHIITDAWSMGILVGEWIDLYEALRAGRPSPLPPLRLQFADFSLWQRRELTAEILDRQIAYWKEQTGPGDGGFSFPPDRLGAAFASSRGASCRLELPADLTSGLKQFCRDRGATLFMGLFAGLVALLFRYTRRSPIVAGTPIFNRTHPEAQKLLGFFVNTLLLRVPVSTSDSFHALVARVREVALSAYENQDVPFNRVVDALRAGGRTADHSPFAIMFGHINTPDRQTPSGDLAFRQIPFTRSRVRFPMEFLVEEFNDRLCGTVEFSTELFSESTVRRILRHWEALLTAGLRNPDNPITDTTVLTAEEQDVLARWNDTETRWADTRCVHRIIEEVAAQNPTDVALVFEGTAMTYRELNTRSNQLAHYLRRKAVGPGRFVGVSLKRSFEMVISLLAIQKAGGAYVPLDPSFPAARLREMVEDCSPACILLHSRDRDKFSSFKGELVILDEAQPAVAFMPDSQCSGRESLSDPAYLIFTSGSTGRPKGAINSHEGLLNRLQWMQAEFQLRPGERVLQKTPYTFDVSVWEFFWPLMVGATLVIARPGGHEDPDYLTEIIREEEIDILHFVPSMLRIFLDAPGAAECRSLRAVVCSGEALSWDLKNSYFEKFNSALYNLYGPTEAAVDVTRWNCRNDCSHGRVPIGKPISNLQIHILDPQLRQMPVLIPGELYIGGAGVGTGYWGRPELTAEKFLPDCFHKAPGSRMYRTGDLVRYLESGDIDYLGRLDTQVKIHGLRIETEEIEVVLKKHAAVRDAVIVAATNAHGKTSLVAYVILSDRAATDASGSDQAATLRSFLLQNLPDYMVPAIFVPLSDFPRTSSGKLDKRALPPPEAAPDGSRYVAPTNSVEHLLCGIWREVLKLERIGIADNFFELGGDSIASIHISARANRSGLRLSPRDVFQRPTIASLAVTLSPPVSRANPKAANARTTRRYPLARLSETELLRLTQSEALPDDLYPLSPLQESMLLNSILAPGSDAFVEQIQVDIHGDFRREAFYEAWYRLMQQYAVLRTGFQNDIGRIPHQVVAADVKVPWYEVDLTGIEESKAVREKIVAVEQDRRAAFELNRAPLFRLLIFDLGSKRVAINWTYHHILLDGWSISVLNEHLLLAYTGHGGPDHYADGSDAPLFRDYIEWLQRQDLGAAERFWRSELTGCSPMKLAFDLNNPGTGVVREHSLQLSAELTGRLAEFAREQQVTLNTVFEGAWALALSRHAVSGDVPFGVTFAGRPGMLAGVERMVGLFATTLPTRIRIDFRLTPGEFLKHLQDKQLAAREFAYPPLSRIHAWSALPRGTPLFDSVMVFENIPEKKPESGSPSGITVTHVKSQGGTLNPLTLLVFPSKAFSLLARFSDARFRPEDIRRITEEFRHLLQHMLDHQHSSLSDIISGTQRLAATPGFRGVAAPSSALPRNLIEELVAAACEEVSGPETAGTQDRRFPADGTSAAAAVVARLQAAFGLQLPAQILSDAPTIAELSRRIGDVLRQLASGPLPPPLVVIAGGAESPLSFAQEHTWLREQLRPADPALMHTAMVRIRRSLNLGAAGQAIRELTLRHEVLRARFDVKRGRVSQVFHPVQPWSLAVVDLADKNSEKRERELQRLATEQSRMPFDLRCDVPFRAKLVRLADDEFAALFTVHKIASDRWSVGILAEEFVRLQDVFASGRSSPLAKPAARYSDYAVWQRQWMAGPVLDAELEFWRKELAGAPELIDLPVDHPRQPTQSFTAAEAPFELSRDVAQGFKHLCNTSGGTLSMGLQAVFLVLLNRFSGQFDLVIGAEALNRTDATAGVIGRFTNPTLLRVNVSGNPTFRELLDQVRNTALRSYPHHDVPFELLIQSVQMQKERSHHPFTQVMLEFSPARPGVEILAEGTEGGSTQLDLTLHIQESAAGLMGGVTYNRDLFERATIQRMMRGLVRLISEGARRPESRIGEMALLSPEEREQIVTIWNRSGQNFAGPYCLHERIEAQVRRRGQGVAVIYGEQQISYDELNRRANRLAHYLMSQRIGVGSIVGICVERSVEMVVGILGVLKAGAAYTPLDPAHPTERLERMLSDAGAAALLTLRGLQEVLKGYAGRRIELDREDFSDQPGDDPHSGATPEDLAYVIYTSGSTGVPKGIEIRHRGVSNNLMDLNGRFGVGPGDRVLGLSSLSFDMSVYELVGMLESGATVVIPEGAAGRDPQQWAQLIGRHRINLWNSAPALLKMLLETVAERPEWWPRSLRLVLLGGDWVPLTMPGQLKEMAPGVRVIVMGGATEASIHSSIYEVERSQADWRSIPYGKPMANQELYVLNRQMEPVPVAVAGELYLGGAGLARGYHRRAQLTAEKFVPHPFGRMAGQRLYRTGDLVKQHADGQLELMGRIDFQVKIRGYRIELGEIESAMRRCAGVVEAIVMAREDTPGRKQLVGYVVTEPGAAKRNWAQELKQALPEYMVPAAIVRLEQLPLTPNGKIDRKALPAPEARPMEQMLVAPRTPVEEVLAGIFCEVLGLEQVGVQDNFFELGGHSLLGTRVVTRIRETFKIEMPLSVIFTEGFTTVAALADVVTRHQLEQLDDAELAQILAEVEGDPDPRATTS